MPGIYNCADLLTLCSEYEGMPMVVLEALSCGIPVVSTDVGDVGEVVIDGVTGYISKSDENELKNKIMKVLEEAERFKYNCIEIAHRYSWDAISERIIDVYKEVQNEVS